MRLGDCLVVDATDCILYIEPRPGYCDRGRFTVKIDAKPGHEAACSLDAADPFPRYYFRISSLLNEINDWLAAKHQQVLVFRAYDQATGSYLPLVASCD